MCPQCGPAGDEHDWDIANTDDELQADTMEELWRNKNMSNDLLPDQFGVSSLYLVST